MTATTMLTYGQLPQPNRRYGMEFLLVVAVILGTAVVEVLVDRAVGVDLSHLSISGRIIHVVVYELAGIAIAATIWFA